MRFAEVLAAELCVALGLVLAAVHPAAAQDYPSKPIRIIVAAGAGGPSDIPARLAAQILQPRLGQPVVVENRPGAAGTVGARYVAGSPADGYTLLVGNTTVLATQPAVSASAGFDPSSFAAVAKVSESYLIGVVNAASPLKTMRALVDHARADPGKLNYGHTGPGGLPNLAGELLKLRAGIDIVGVPFRSGSESVTAVMNQAIDLTFESITILLPLIREGKLRPLAVASDGRTPLLPDLPTTKEAGIADFEVTSFNGIVAPAGTPDEIVRKLNAALNEGLQTAQVKETLARLGAVPSHDTPEEFARFIMTQFVKWQAVAKAASIRID
ncbi:MAG: tripartite tricarboxylate transporter substrate binding protein [Hyphomicrobiales bacterium]|nr:tripartite tricarboxylate transporter substrate binding protein [Hyphomicrobiales bacterium]